MRHRDVMALDLPGGDRLLIATDTSGGIGPKPDDFVQASAYVVGRFTARVVLMEAIAAGGRPISLIDACYVEPDPTGREILSGVLDEAALAGLPAEAVTGSFEKNVCTLQTGLGITALALAERPFGLAHPGDLVVAIGKPKVGKAVRLDDPEIADLPLVMTLARDPAVHDILPVGSRGIGAEAGDMAESAGLRAELLPAEPGWDLNVSAGPATTCLIAIAPATLPGVALVLDRPWSVVGRTLHA